MKILIAGASGGIGKYLAEHLSQAHEVLGTYNSRKPDHECSYSMYKVDVTCEKDVANWINTTCSEVDDLALIYCVGINYNCMMHKSEADKWEAVIGSNLIGIRHVLRYLLPLMRVKKSGRIVLLSSVVPIIGVAGTSAYSASKAAMWGLSKAVAMENANFGITVNTINLGYFNIGMICDIPPDKLNKIVNSIPIGHLGDPRNIVDTIEYLIKADYVTGSQINLNGGLV